MYVGNNRNNAQRYHFYTIQSKVWTDKAWIIRQFLAIYYASIFFRGKQRKIVVSDKGERPTVNVKFDTIVDQCGMFYTQLLQLNLVT